MSEAPGGRAAFRYRTAELAVAAFFFLLGAIVIYDSVRLGAKWGADGPQAGYFPFYIGPDHLRFRDDHLRARACSCPARKTRSFVEIGQLKLVLSVLVPSGVYVALIGLARHLRGLGAVHRVLHALAGQVRLVEGGAGVRSATAWPSS